MGHKYSLSIGHARRKIDLRFSNPLLFATSGIVVKETTCRHDLDTKRAMFARFALVVEPASSRQTLKIARIRIAGLFCAALALELFYVTASE